jgi:hypothetical protein
MKTRNSCAVAALCVLETRLYERRLSPRTRGLLNLSRGWRQNLSHRYLWRLNPKCRLLGQRCSSLRLSPRRWHSVKRRSSAGHVEQDAYEHCDRARYRRCAERRRRMNQKDGMAKFRQIASCWSRTIPTQPRRGATSPARCIVVWQPATSWIIRIPEFAIALARFAAGPAYPQVPEVVDCDYLKGCSVHET